MANYTTSRFWEQGPNFDDLFIFLPAERLEYLLFCGIRWGIGIRSIYRRVQHKKRIEYVAPVETTCQICSVNTDCSDFDLRLSMKSSCRFDEIF